MDNEVPKDSLSEGSVWVTVLSVCVIVCMPLCVSVCVCVCDCVYEQVF